MCKCVECPPFVHRYLPEFTWQSTYVWLGIKGAIICVLAACLTLFEAYLDERIFETGSSITFATIIIVIMFMLTVSWLIVIYVPYMWHISPFWYSATISVIYAALMIFFTLNGLVFDRIKGVDNPAFDGWTSVHTIAGVFLGFIMPFVPLLYVISVWEVLEAEWTKGLGDGESLGNHVVDVLVAIVGWFFTVLLCMYLFPKLECKQTTLNFLGARDESKKDECLIPWKQHFYRIPWISARAASCKSCYWDYDWSEEPGSDVTRNMQNGQTDTV